MSVPLLPPPAEIIAAPSDSAITWLTVLDFDAQHHGATGPSNVSAQSPRVPIPDLRIMHQVFLI